MKKKENILGDTTKFKLSHEDGLKCVQRLEDKQIIKNTQRQVDGKVV